MLLKFLLKLNQLLFSLQISSLERLGALTNLSLTVKRMLSILLTDEVGRKYSFDGRTKKRSFKDLRIKTIVIGK